MFENNLSLDLMLFASSSLNRTSVKVLLSQCYLPLRAGVPWHRVEFWQIKNILDKMTAVASTRVWVMVDHKLPALLQTYQKLDLALIFRSVSLTQ